ncbi:monovalent cation/H(+) antiporter subunit G [Bacillus sp. FJAT-29790]|uniref:monovalent cation/H(+) antiporter subunit G n=1 Tax=Bacillus sp. FJAT-29790 TaxID=1895002 RepID=UPI001C23782E|nr:monovalent cation/H(+) antiporter subunit G [Bacillus sp. FJAT-29790]MBU8880394.1 monovalent cation/H(+) antiporter subunit G [Bacillus sp. FJAT-29790]
MSENIYSEIIVAIFLLIGTIFSFLSAIGLIRLPDVYTRAHAVSKSASLGVLCTLFGAFLFFLIADGYFSIRLILGIFFVFLTSPVVAHLLNRAAYRSNVELAKESVQDDLKEFLGGNEK